MGLSIATIRPSRLGMFAFGRVAVLVLLIAVPVFAQHSPSFSPESPHVGHAEHPASGDGWEGSEKGIAYSESNHHIAGLLVIIMGLAELSHVLRLSSLRWARFLLPSALLLAGVFLMVWSDHDAWPIGSLGFVETFGGADHEILQHKIYGILVLMVGSVEFFRRSGRIGHKAWTSPLPLMAIVGGVMLFSHSHGSHPAAHKIAVHHAIMGTMAVTAGSSKLVSAWIGEKDDSTSTRWEWVWVAFMLLIGTQLLLYTE
jgi:putative copper resistance protein D